MQFFDSFSSLGYSAINLFLVFLFFYVALYRVLKLHIRHWIFKILFSAIILGLFIFSANFLAEQNKMLNEAIRAEGGLQRTQER